MPKRKRTPEDEELTQELTRDTPVKIDLPFDEAVRRLTEQRQETSEDEPGSEGDSR